MLSCIKKKNPATPVAKKCTPANTNIYWFPKDSDQIEIWLNYAGTEHSMIEQFMALSRQTRRFVSHSFCTFLF